MKTFLMLVVLSVGSGLAVRYMMHRHDKPVATPQVVTQPRPIPPPPEPTHDEPPTPPTPTPTPRAPEPPRIAGSVQISDATVQHFAAAPGVIYYCNGTSVMAQPKTGGPPQVVGECEGAFDFVADAQSVFYCDQHHLKRITAGTQGDHVVADVECIMEALDAKYAYFVVPGFEGVENPGVYRVARAGGTPEKIHATRPHEQFMLTVDDDALWIAAWAAGTISKLAKTPNATARAIVTGQKGIVSFAIDQTYVYWYAENTTEVKRRKKTGGAIEVIGHDVAQEPVRCVDGHAYWFEGSTDTRLMHLAPGAAKPETLASGLHTPSLVVDAEGAYVAELDREGVFMFKR